MKIPFFAVLAVALSAPALAQDAVLVKVSGPVSYLPGGARRFVQARGGEQLLFGDAIRVREGGAAHVVFGDRAALLLRGDALLSLGGTPARTALTVDYGEFLIGLFGRLGKGRSFKVNTPAAVAAVRGTLFWGKADRADKSTTYAGFGHRVEVTAQGRTVAVEPGMTVVVPLDAPPGEPAPSAIGLDYVESFRVDGSLEGVDALAEPEKLKK